MEKVPEVKDTVHKQSLLHHVCAIVEEKFPDSTDLYSEIGAVTRLTKVCLRQAVLTAVSSFRCNSELSWVVFRWTLISSRTI